MRTRSRTVLLSSMLFISGWTRGQEASQTAPQKDPQALAVLLQVAAVTGWNSLNLPRDAVATGRGIRYKAGAPETVELSLKARGPYQYRAEIQTGATVVSTVVNGLDAATFGPNGSRFISPESAVSIRPWALPFFTDITALGDPAVTLRYLGPEELEGITTHKVEIARQFGSSEPLAGSRARAGKFMVWVSTSTGLPVQIGYPLMASDHPKASITAIRRFSDYRSVLGIAVPFQQEELVQGTPRYSLQLTNVSFNVGLSDSDFQLPTR